MSAGDAESATLNVIDVVEAPVAVPVIAPVALARVRPVGSAPEVIDQVCAPTPPLAASVVEYRVPAVPFGRLVVVMEIATPEIESVSALLTLFAPWGNESVTLNVIDVVEVPVGVPVIAPVALASVRPAGSAPAVIDQVTGDVPPLEVRVAAYGAPAVPVGRLEVARDSGAAFSVMPKASVAISAVGVSASVTLMIAASQDVFVGVPEMTPVVALRDSPAGNEPEATDQW
jgi:hypothetical protein